MPERDTLEDRMRRQTEMAIREADVTLLVIDARAGVTPIDKFFAGEIRKSGKHVILLANKCEGKAGRLVLPMAGPLALVNQFRFRRRMVKALWICMMRFLTRPDSLAWKLYCLMRSAADEDVISE